MPPAAGQVASLDKVAHFCEYLGFAWVLLRARRSTMLQAEKPPHPLLHVWFLSSGYGLLLELVQRAVPWRGAEWADAGVNALGAAVGIWIGRRH